MLRVCVLVCFTSSFLFFLLRDSGSTDTDFLGQCFFSSSFFKVDCISLKMLRNTGLFIKSLIWPPLSRNSLRSNVFSFGKSLSSLFWELLDLWDSDCFWRFCLMVVVWQGSNLSLIQTFSNNFLRIDYERSPFHRYGPFLQHIQ